MHSAFSLGQKEFSVGEISSVFLHFWIYLLLLLLPFNSCHPSKMATEQRTSHKSTDFDEIEEKEWIELPESSPEDKLHNGTGQQLVTITGTVTRGYQAGHVVEVQLELTQEELRKLTLERKFKDDDTKRQKARRCTWGLRSGLHVVLLGVICVPAAFIFSTAYSFYIGCNTWYNFYLYFSEEKTIWHKISICPILILTFPFTIGFSAFTIGVYASVIQISWFFHNWLREFRDYEKGFYGWLCNKVTLPECSPYEVVVLNCPDTPTDIKSPSNV